MNEIINIALDTYTDFHKFEELATTILNDSGYDNIVAVGGIGDDGVDAQEIIYKQNIAEKIIFQYSLDKKSKQKIEDTITKLKTNNVSFHQLVYVTTVQINNIGEIKADIRKKYGSDFSIEIIERATIIARLQKNNDKLFNRYFSNIKAQLANLIDNETYFTENSNNPFQSSLLKCSLLFTFNPNAKATRKDLFDKLILSVIVSIKELSISEISSFLKKKYSRDIPEEQIKSSIDRLKRDKFVVEKDNKIQKTTKTTEVIEGNVLGINQETEAIINDIIEKVKKISNKSIDNAVLSKIKANIKSSLSAYFRLHGFDYVNSDQILIANIDKNDDLIKITKGNGLPNEIGDLLVYSLGDTLKNPTEQQAETLFKWAKALYQYSDFKFRPYFKGISKNNVFPKNIHC